MNDSASAVKIPYRLDLAGSWHDQPFVSRHADGSVITVALAPGHDYDERGGLASSTRKSALDLWPEGIPPGDRIKLGKILFCYDNPPGSKTVSGSQDALGIVLPGLNRLHYSHGEYWPVNIDSVHDESILTWIERHVVLVALGPREPGYDVLAQARVDAATAGAMAAATEACWDAILAKDLAAFGKYMTAAFRAQAAMLPHVMTRQVERAIGRYSDETAGYKLAGAGGGGYLILATEKKIQEARPISIVRA